MNVEDYQLKIIGKLLVVQLNQVQLVCYGKGEGRLVEFLSVGEKEFGEVCYRVWVCFECFEEGSGLDVVRIGGNFEGVCWQVLFRK